MLPNPFSSFRGCPPKNCPSGPGPDGAGGIREIGERLKFATAGSRRSAPLSLTTASSQVLS